LPELSVLVLETGIGAECTRRALEWVLSGPMLENVPYRPKLVLSAGFCGAVREDLQVGDVVLAGEVADVTGKSWPTTWPGELPSGEWRPPLHRGKLLTVNRIISSAEEKQALAREHDALVVDMESALFPEPCRRAAVPFGCVRAVSDDARTALSPQLACLVAGARASPIRVLTTIATGPSLLPELWRLRRHTRVAAEQLGKALGELLTLTLPWSME
jgi:adenosylhomocysteine nucleosidase